VNNLINASACHAINSLKYQVDTYINPIRNYCKKKSFSWKLPKHKQWYKNG